LKTTFSEFIGSALLLAVITGSGYMAETLSNGNAAVALLGNSIATGAGLYVLITLLSPISGAHFNPVVSMMFWVEGVLPRKKLISYILAQFCGAILGVWITHVMFNLPIIQLSSKSRSGFGQAISECIATLILLMVIRLGVRQCSEKIPMLVALVVT
jgi:glycerol uptake facilitator-like aquaporin